jgi:hypothetical protein
VIDRDEGELRAWPVVPHLPDDVPRLAVLGHRTASAGYAAGARHSGPSLATLLTAGPTATASSKALADLATSGELVNPRDKRGYRLPDWPRRPRTRSLF